MKFKYLSILFLFLYEFSMGQFPGSSRILIQNFLSQSYTLNYTISADLSSATVSAITLNNGRSPVTTSGIIMGTVFPLTLSTAGATITTNGNISGGTYSNTFTGLSQSNATYFVAYATTNNGTSYGNPLIIPQQTVYNAATGKTWMAYNVGASNIPGSLTDTAGYGFLFQWGRGPDGHQIVRPTTSGTTLTRATSDNASNGGQFIIGQGADADWRTPGNTSLWTGNTTGNNNPCPTNFRVPTNDEFDSEINSWVTKNGDGAFNSSLKLTYGGYREGTTGTLKDVGTAGWYWVSNFQAKTRYYKKISAATYVTNTTALPSWAMAVRCIKY